MRAGRREWVALGHGAERLGSFSDCSEHRAGLPGFVPLPHATSARISGLRGKFPLWN
jgi:hypothetical protein